MQNSGASRRGNAKPYLNCRDVIARSDLSAVAPRATASAEARRAKEEGGSDEAIQFAMPRYGLLRGARHRAALCADPLARHDVVRVKWLFENLDQALRLLFHVVPAFAGTTIMRYVPK
jgi:hypothetical protein